MLELFGEAAFDAIPILGLMAILGVLIFAGRKAFPKVHPHLIAVAVGALVAAVIMAVVLRQTSAIRS